MSIRSNEYEPPQPATRIKMEDFLRVYREVGSIRKASQIVGIPPSSIVYWRRLHPEFNRQYKEVQQDLVDMIEQTAYQMALEGDTKMITLILSRLHPDYKQASGGTKPVVLVADEFRVAGLSVEQAKLRVAEHVLANGAADDDTDGET